jgi:flagellar biosynthetic protein FliR
MESFVVNFVPVALRIAGMLLFAPLIGTRVVPGPLKLMFAAVLALATVGSAPVGVPVPESTVPLAIALGAELLLGALSGLGISLVFLGAQLAGDIAGQQMGFNFAGSVDPATGLGTNPLSDLYYILAVCVFLLIDGHHTMIMGLRASFACLPPLAVSLSGDALEVFTGMLAGATSLGLRLAAPVCLTILVSDLALGMIGRTIPQLGFLNVGTSVRVLGGLAVVLLGLGLTASVLGGAINDVMALAESLASVMGK